MCALWYVCGMTRTIFLPPVGLFFLSASQRRDLNATLARHAARYPKMEPADAVKLVYQSVFGGGHLIENEADSLRFLSEERAAALLRTPADAHPDAFEPIGFGYVRLYLTGREIAALPDALLNRAFVLSSRSPNGGMPLFEASLRALRRAVERGVFSFSKVAFSDCLAGYRAAGFPPARHSEAYRRAYAPAYRVLSAAYASALSALCQANAVPPNPEWISNSPGITPETRDALRELLLSI